MALFAYMQQTQRFLREQGQVFENVDDLMSYVNRARREIAYRTESLRVIGTISTVILSVWQRWNNPFGSLSSASSRSPMGPSRRT